MTRISFAALCWRRWWLLCCLAASLPAWCQQLPLRYYGQAEGLGNLSVGALAQTRDGFLWAGTENGLFRFDGNRFRKMGPADGLAGGGLMNWLALDGAGRLWAASNDGLFVLERERFAEVRASREQGLPTYHGFQSLAPEPDGKMLVISGGRLYRVSRAGGGQGWQVRPVFTAQQVDQVPDLGALVSVLAARDGSIWLGAWRLARKAGRQVQYMHGSLYRLKDGRLQRFGAAQGVPDQLWGGLLEQPDGQLWLRSANRLLQLAPGAGHVTDRTGKLPPSQGLDVYHPLLLDRSGRLLGSAGASLFRGRDGQWDMLGREAGLKTGGGINAMLLDREGELWLALAGLGLVHWQGYPHWSNWTPAQGLPADDAWSFLRRRDGQLLVGTGAGLAQQGAQGARFQRVAVTGGLAQLQWSALAEDRGGRVWGGTFTGHLLLRGRSGAPAELQARLPSIYRILPDGQGRLWIATSGGLYTLDPARERVPRYFAGMENVLGRGNAHFSAACTSRDGAHWFLSDAGLARLADGQWSRVALLGLEGRAPGLMACGPGELWLGDAASGTLWRTTLPVGAAGRLALSRFDALPPRMAGRLLQSLLVDSRGWLWIGTDAGAAAWNRKQWRLFDQQSGLVWNDLNQNALYEDSLDGSIWIGTTYGVSHIERPQELFRQQPLPLRVAGMRFNGRRQDALGGMTLPWSGSALQFSLASLSFRNRDALRYHYRLKGLEPEWSVSDSPELRYAALPPGSYVLQARAENVMLQSGSSLLELPFSVQPPWWRSTWFCLLAAALAAAALHAAHRWRLGVLLRRQRALDQAVKARTAELEASRDAHRLRALKDGLTQAWNRSAMTERISQCLLQLEQGGDTFVLVLLDLDHFKRINDRHGHLAGDAVLKEVVRRLQAGVRGSDAVGRYGGEEFVLLLPELDAARGAQRIAALHRAIGAQPVPLPDGGQLPVTASFGVVTAQRACGHTPESLLQAADMALYRAKANGRNRVEHA